MANSIQLAVSDGTLVLLNLSIDYFDRSEITVFFDSVQVTEGSGWAWVGLTDKSIAFAPAVPNGVEVLVKRTTDLSKLRHEFSTGAAFAARILDEDLKQVLHIAQEASESNLSGEFFVDINMHNKRITNVADAVDPQDVLTKGQFDAAVGDVLSDAADATTAANAAASSANTAAASANAAATSANALRTDLESTAAPQGAALIGRGIQVVTEVAQIRGLDKTKPSKYVILDGPTSFGVHGNGVYYFDAADTTSADDGFNTIVAADGGRWKRLRLIWQTTTTGADVPTYQFARNTTHSGGTPGVVTNALNVSTTVGAGVTNFEWAFLAQMDNSATAGENVAVYAQALKRAQGPTWAGCFEIQDKHTADPAAGGALGIELACSANGGDTAFQRIGLHIAMGKNNAGGTTCEWGTGVYAGAGADSRYARVFYNDGPTRLGVFYNAADSSNGALAGVATFLDTGKSTYGVDLSAATYSGVAMRMAAGQGIAFDTTGSPARIRKAGSNLAFENVPALFSGGRVQMNTGFGMPASGNTAATASAGTSGALPAQVAGYLIFQLDGNNFKIPYYGP